MILFIPDLACLYVRSACHSGTSIFSCIIVITEQTHLKATTLLQLDSFSHICEDMGRQILTYGRRMTPLEIFARIDAVTVEDVRDTAKILILNEDHCMAAIGSLENLPDYDEIRGKSF